MNLGKSVYRVGDQVSVGVRYTDPAALAEASELTAELEIAGQPPEPLGFERAPDDPALLTATFPAEQAGAYTLRIVPATGVDAGAATRVSTTTFRVEPPRREIDEPSLNRALLADLARLTGGRVFELAEVRKLDEAIPMREVTRTLEKRDELWDAPLLLCDHRPGPDGRVDFAQDVPNGLKSDRPNDRPARPTVTTETATRTAELGSLREEQARLRAGSRGSAARSGSQMALEFALDAAAGTVAAAVVLVALDCVAPARPDVPSDPAGHQPGRARHRPGDPRWSRGSGPPRSTTSRWR